MSLDRGERERERERERSARAVIDKGGRQSRVDAFSGFALNMLRTLYLYSVLCCLDLLLLLFVKAFVLTIGSMYFIQ